MPECGYCSKEFAAVESYCHTLAAAMDCPKVDLVQRAVLTAVAESIEKGATVDLGDGQFQKVPGAEDAAQPLSKKRNVPPAGSTTYLFLALLADRLRAGISGKSGAA